MFILIITRLLDIFTTYLNVNKWGWSVEGNPIVRSFGEQGGFICYQILVFLIISTIAELLPKYKRMIYLSISCISMVAVIINLFCFIFIR